MLKSQNWYVFLIKVGSLFQVIMSLKFFKMKVHLFKKDYLDNGSLIILFK